MKQIKPQLIFSLCAVTVIFIYYSIHLTYGQIFYNSKLYFLVKYEYFGSDAETIEELITRPLEEKLFELENIYEVTSICQLNQSSTYITFNSSADYDSTYLKLRNITDQLSNILPSDVQTPQIISTGFNDNTIICVSFNSQKAQIENYKSLFESIEDVAEVSIFGQENSSLVINYKPEQLAKTGISTNSFSNYISKNNQSDQIIKIKNNDYTANLKFTNSITSAHQFSQINIPVQSSLIPITELAELSLTTNSPQELTLLNNKTATILTIKPSSNSNWIKISDRCRSLLKLPELSILEPHIIYDEGKKQKEDFLRIIKNLALTFVVLFFLLFFSYGNFYNTALCLFTIILSLIWTLGILSFLNITITTQIISGLSLSTGIVVDIPLYLISTAKQNSSTQHIKTVRTNIYLSQITTLIVIAAILLLKNEVPQLYPTMLSLFIMIISATIISIFFLSPFTIPAKTRLIYNKGIRILYNSFFNKTLLNNKFKIFSLGISIAIIIFSSLFTSTKLETQTQSDILKITVDFKPEKKIASIQNELSSFLDEIQNLETINFTKTQISRGHAEIEIISETKISDNILNKIKRLSSKIPDGTVYFPLQDDNSKAEIQCIISGPEIKKTQEYSNLLALELNKLSEIETVVLNFKSNEKEIFLEPDTEILSRKNISTAETAELLRTNLFGPVITKYLDKGIEKDVRLKSTGNDKYSDLLNQTLCFQNLNEKLSELAKISKVQKPSRLYRYNGSPCSFLTVTLTKNSSACINLLTQTFKAIPHNENYTLKFSKKIYETKDTYTKLIKSLIICIITLLLFLTAVFENFTKSLTILISIPVTLSLPFLIMLIKGSALDLGFFIGLIILCGISINNIIIVKNTTYSKKNNLADLEGIFLTTATTLISSAMINLIDKDQFTTSITEVLIYGSIISLMTTIYLIKNNERKEK